MLLSDIDRRHLLAVARGEEKADIVFKNGTVINVCSGELQKTDVAVCGSLIAGLGRYRGVKEIDCSGKYLAPGLIDAHVHIESSMLRPGELSKVLVQTGTTCVIADPHECVNVCGVKALDYMLAATEHMLVDAYMMIPSSVPSADTEINGCGEFSAEMMKPYLRHPRVLGLGEAMRVGDVVSGEMRMTEKLNLFGSAGLHVDGHFPGGTGHFLQAYRAAGVENDHENSTGDEALEKLRAGLAVYIREGSGAKNLDNVLGALVKARVSLANCMFCTDDKHTAEIKREGHISTCVHKAIALGVDPVQAYRMACWQTARFYGLNDRGSLSAGLLADILILNHPGDLFPVSVMKNGCLLGDKEYNALYDIPIPDELLHTVHLDAVDEKMIRVEQKDTNTVIGMVPGELLTRELHEHVNGSGGFFIPDAVYNKLCVFERHGRTHTAAAAPLKGFCMHGGAVATSVSHDSHNIIAAGDNDGDILNAVRCVAQMQGGYALSSGGTVTARLPLPLFGLMSTASCTEVEHTLAGMLDEAHRHGIRPDIDPFITLSFMALPVIPEIRLSDKGLIIVR